MPESINSKLKEQYDHDDSGGSLDTNLGDFLDSEGASGTSNNSKWRDWASGTGTSLNTRLFHKHGGSGSFMTRWKNWIAFSSTHSFNFDGSNDYLNCGNTSLELSAQISLSFWAKNNSSGLSSSQYITSQYDYNSNQRSFRIFFNSDEKITFSISKTGSDFSQVISSSAISNIDSWNHFVLTFNAGAFKLYVNGTDTSITSPSNASVDAIHNATTDILVGSALNGALYWDGLIDEVAIWDTALSASDVTSIYNNGKVIDLSKSASYGTDRTGNLKLWLRCGDKAEPESTTAIARQDFYTDFDGTDDMVALGSDASIDNVFVGGATVTAWIKPSSDGENNFGRIFDKSTATAGTDGWHWLVTDESSSKVELRFGHGFSGSQPYWDSSLNVALNEWNHVAVTYDNGSTSNNPKFYINGISVTVTSGTVPSGSATDDSSQDLFIGNNTGGERSFAGAISSASIYKTILDAQTISQMAKSRFTPMRDNRFSVVDFDGADDIINCGSDSSLDNIWNGGGTLTAWIYPRSDGEGDFGMIAVKRNGNTSGWYLATNDESGGVCDIRLRSARDTADGGWATTSREITLNQWNHIAISYDSDSDSNDPLIYVNGISVGVTENDTPSGSHSSDASDVFKIGGDAGDFTYDGSISSLAVYNTIKSAEEIYAIYQQGITYDESSESGLIGYWRMGDDTSKAYPTIADSSSNSNDGTITNGALDDIVQQMVAGYDLGAFESSSEELSGEFVQDTSFELSGEQSAGTNGTYYNLHSEVSISNGQLISNATGSTSTSLVDAISVEQGKVYKIEIVVASGSSNASISITNSNNSIATGFITYSEGSNIVYYTPSATGDLTRFKGSNGTRVWTIDSFSFKEVLQSEVSDTYPAIIDVNEPVLGIEASADPNMEGSGNNDDPYRLTASQWTFNTTDNRLQYDDTSTGAVYQFNQYMANSFVANQTYRIKFTIGGLTSGVARLKFSAGDLAYDFVADNTVGYANGTHYAYFTTTESGSDSNGFAVWGLVDSGSSWYFTELSFKPVQGNVGTMTNQDSADLVYSSVLPDQSFLTGANSSYGFGSFDGTNDIVTASAVNTDYKSVSVWLKPSTTITPASSGSELMFFGNWTFGSVALGSQTGDFTNELITLTDNDGVTKKTAWIPSSGETIPNDSWTHLAFVWDGSKYVIYYNGQPQTVVTASNGHIPLNTNKDIRIGTGGASSSSFFDGDITGVAFWNKSLTDAQILSIYNNGRHSNLYTDFSDNLITYLAFGNSDATSGFEDTSSTIYDRSGNSNHGTVSGTTLQSPPNAEPNGYAKGDTNRSTTTP